MREKLDNKVTVECNGLRVYTLFVNDDEKVFFKAKEINLDKVVPKKLSPSSIIFSI